MSNVIVKENETLDSALRRFKRSCAKAGIQQEIRKREHYEKPSVRRNARACESPAGYQQEIRKREHYEKPSVRRKKKSEAARKRKYN